MEEINAQIAKIKAKKNPAHEEMFKYIRYMINVKKIDTETVLQDVKSWDPEVVKDIIADVERENLKPKPKRYYVSLKEPLEGER